MVLQLIQRNLPVNQEYCKDFTSYKRRHTIEVKIGNTPLGGENPIRIQSMTNTDTGDTYATVKQIKRIANEGGDYVRLTVPNLKDAENLRNICTELSKQGCFVPIIADIHFNPKIARIAATIVDKVRINPGNFVDRKSAGLSKYSEKQYNNELEKLRQEFIILLNICKENGTALRIGTNHGSLSDRIMSRYGDTPEGMTESAMEFLRICRDEKFDDVVVSMKASNTRIMVYASRLLVKKMSDEGMAFPVHLGVTEAGEGEDGRIKSAVGIGTMLADGIGETIRVSLTEDPELEIPVAKKLVAYFSSRVNHAPILPFGNFPINAFNYSRRGTVEVENIGGFNVPVVISSINDSVNITTLKKYGWNYNENSGWSFDDISPDFLMVKSWPKGLPVPGVKSIILSYSEETKESFSQKGVIPLYTFIQYSSLQKKTKGILFILAAASQVRDEFIEMLKADKNVVLIVETENNNGFADQRSAAFRLINSGCLTPIIFSRSYLGSNIEDFQLKSAADLGGLFIDGLGDGIWIENSDNISVRNQLSTVFGILQASRVRISRTEYISCPSCGRTLFDLQTTTREIRERTEHLKGLKIGIMGCIVNGPGEMADADYGYVGTGKGHITLYKGKEVVKRHVPEAEAVEELILLLKENGDWVDP